MSDPKQKEIIDLTMNELRKMLTSLKEGKQPIMSSNIRALRREINKLSKEEVPQEDLDNWANDFVKNIKKEQ